MKTVTFLAAVTFSLSLVAGCSSSSSGDGDTGSAQGSGGGGGGGSSACADVPLDCIGGDYVTDENGCTTCQYFECAGGFCIEGYGECAGQGLFVCDRGAGDCGALDAEVGIECAGYVCTGGEWTCQCPFSRPPAGTACGDVGQVCTVESDVDCGPPTVEIVCTDGGWMDNALDGAGGGTDCG